MIKLALFIYKKNISSYLKDGCVTGKHASHLLFAMCYIDQSWALTLFLIKMLSSFGTKALMGYFLPDRCRSTNPRRETQGSLRSRRA